MSDKQRYAFVSDNGTVIGVGLASSAADVSEGTALAMLNEPTDLPTWICAIAAALSVEHAADEMVNKHGGVRLAKVVTLNNAVVVPFVLGTTVVGEA